MPYLYIAETTQIAVSSILPRAVRVHRYNEFHELYEKLRKAFPAESSGIKFPGKRILGNNFDPDFIKLRREALHDFTSRLMKVCRH